jgi:hypothetical protein
MTSLSRSVAAVLLVLAVAGCATKEKYDLRLRDWVGEASDDLVRSWGPPASTFKLRNGNEMFVYDKRIDDTYTTPTQISQAPGTVAGSVFIPGPTTVTGGETRRRVYTCRTQFEIDPAGKIVRYQFDGDACRGR